MKNFDTSARTPVYYNMSVVILPLGSLHAVTTRVMSITTTMYLYRNIMLVVQKNNSATVSIEDPATSLLPVLVTFSVASGRSGIQDGAIVHKEVRLR